jgi:hypothetical protein
MYICSYEITDHWTKSVKHHMQVCTRVFKVPMNYIQMLNLWPLASMYQECVLILLNRSSHLIFVAILEDQVSDVASFLAGVDLSN